MTISGADRYSQLANLLNNIIFYKLKSHVEM